MSKGTSPQPTPQQARFVAEYLVDVNATQAAIRAGYSKKTANVQGARLLTNVRVRAAIAEGAAKHLQKVDLVAEDVLLAIARHVRADGRADIRHLLDEHGNVVDPKSLTDEAAMRIAGFEVVKRNLTTGDDKVDTIIKVKLRDHSKYVELAAKYLGMLTDRVHLTGDWDKLAARLASARRRASFVPVNGNETSTTMR